MASGSLRGRAYCAGSLIEDAVVAWSGGEITYAGPAEAYEGPAASVTEGLIVPGLVDVHCHGGGGSSFPDSDTVELAHRAVLEHRAHGTTTLVASLVTAAPDTLRQRTGVLVELCEAGELAGIHYEGPFLSKVRCGAQDPALIQEPSADLTRELIDLGRGHVVTMTVAPEFEGNLEVAKALIEGGALPSWGHTDAGPTPTRKALKHSVELIAAQDKPRSGRATITHLFNGMKPLHHRDPGPIGEILAAARQGECVVEMIGDGTHLDTELVREVIEIVGEENCVFVTDAMAAAGLGDGSYRLGSMDVTVSEGVARLTEGGAIAGGTAHLLDVVREAIGGGIPVATALRLATENGAAILGRTDVGVLAAGARADVLVLDEDYRVAALWRGGVEVA